MSRLVFPDDFRPDFPGFGRAAFAFLRALAKNNDRAWFTANKEIYEAELRFPMECLIAEFRGDHAGKGLAVRGDPSRAVFRIHRDIRFSKDKTPYKTHVGAVLSRSGGRSDQGGVYIHIQPGNCFISAGFCWRPEPAVLTRWRNRMAEDPDRWLDVIAAFRRKNDKVFMRAISALKTMPRGFQNHAGTPVEGLSQVEVVLDDPPGDAGRGERPRAGRHHPRSCDRSDAAFSSLAGHWSMTRPTMTHAATCVWATNWRRRPGAAQEVEGRWRRSPTS